jgi:DNA polymerase (family 10)
MSAADTLRLPLAQARALAEKIAGALREHCVRLEIAGSIRRGRPYCGDIDLVVLPKSVEAITAILDRCAVTAKPLKRGEQYVVFTLANGFQLDLWIAHPDCDVPGDMFGHGAERQRCNFGVLLLARTGSAMHNVWIAQQAQALGLHFNPHKGILRRGEVIASAEEADIFRALQLDFIPPERRER